MSDNVLPSLYPSLIPGPESPVFISPVDEKYKCIKCYQVLREAVQTPCGHRICRLCWSEVIQGHPSAPCPAGEEECSTVTAEQVYPDFSARKEILRLEVFCTHKDHGCQEKVKLGKLKEHLDQRCLFSKYLCPFNCGETLRGPTLLEQHKDVCARRPSAALEMAESVDKVREEVQSISHSMKQMEKRIQPLEKRQRDIITSTANFGVKVTQLEASNSNFITKRELEQHFVEFKRLQERVQLLEGKVNKSQSSGGASNVSGDAIDALRQHERQLAIVDVRLAEADLRMLSMESTNYSGVLVWKISDFKRRKEDAVSGKTLSLYSQPFFTTRYGYRLCARAYLNGDGQGRGTHFSLFFVVMRGEYDNLLAWPFQQRVTMSLLDQDRGRKHLTDTFRPDPSSTSFRKPISEMNVASGCPLFARQSLLEQPPYLKDNSVFIKVVVDTSDLSL